MKIVLLVLALILGLLVIVPAYAGIYPFEPDDKDLGDLDHNYFYKWGINWTLPSGEKIVSATLDIKEIYNWDRSANVLYTHLLNSGAVGVVRRYDGDGGGDSFAGQGLKLGQWSDTDSDKTKDPLSYSIPADHFGWLADGNWAFGLDPNCHFYNSGVSCTVVTSPVPEPAGLLAVTSGLVSLVGLGKRRLARPKLG